MIRPRKSYLHCITNAAGQSYYVDGYDNSGVPKIKLSAQPYWLQFSAKNWKDIQVAYGRDLSKYHGINRTFTDGYEFVADGADVIRYLNYKRGYEEIAYLNILRHNPDNDTYETFYKGQIDLKEIKDNQPASVTVNLIGGGFITAFNANDEQDYEFEFDNSAIDVMHDGVDLKSSIQYQVVELEEYFYLNHIIPLNFRTNEGAGSGIEYHDQQYESSNSSYSSTSDNWAYKNDEDRTIAIEGQLKVTVISSDNGHLNYQPGFMVSPAANFTFMAPNQIINVGNQGVFAINQTITVPAGQKLFIGGRSFANLPGDNIAFSARWDASDLKISLITRKAATIVKAYQPFTMLQKLINKITGRLNYTAVSTLLQQNKNITITCGDAIRGIEGATLKTNFINFFKAYNAVLFASFSINGANGIFESRQSVYDSQVTNIEAGEVADLQIDWAKELFFNSIKAGYQNQTYDDLNGRLEPNTTMTLTAPATEKKELDLTSPYRADPYGIEYLRINLEGKTTTDNSGDNDVFFLNVKEQTQIAGTISIDWLRSTQTLKMYGLAANIGSFAVGSMFKLINATYDQFNKYYTVVSATVNGSDLDIVVAEQVADSAAGFGAEVYLPHILNRDVTLLSGGLPENIYNIAQLTPKQIVLRHGAWIRSVLFMLGSKMLSFQTLDKNKELSFIFNGNTIIEKADVLIGSLAAPFFYPLIFSAKTLVPDTFNNVMAAAVNAHISALFNARPLYGFPVNLSVRPVFNEVQEWQLLASTLNNIDDLLNLEPLIINTDNMAQYNLSVSYLCPLQFVPVGNIILDQYNTVDMDAGFWAQQVRNYLQTSPYKYKWQTNDIVKLQCYTNDLGPVQADIIDCRGRNYGTISLNNVVTSVFQPPYLLYEGNITLANLQPGIYGVLLTAGTGAAQVQFISEVIDLKVVHPNTKLFTYSHRKNKLSTIFSTGYTPDFRIEADIEQYLPKLNFSSFEDEPADLQLIEAMPYDTFSLQIGKGTFGIPAPAIKKLNAIMGLSDVYIDGIKYTREEDAQFEVERVSGVAGAFYSLAIRKGNNNQAHTIGTDANVSKKVLVIYNIQTQYFGDLSGQVSGNVVQVTKLENS